MIEEKEFIEEYLKINSINIKDITMSDIILLLEEYKEYIIEEAFNI